MAGISIQNASKLFSDTRAVDDMSLRSRRDLPESLWPTSRATGSGCLAAGADVFGR